MRTTSLFKQLTPEQAKFAADSLERIFPAVKSYLKNTGILNLLLQTTAITSGNVVEKAKVIVKGLMSNELMSFQVTLASTLALYNASFKSKAVAKIVVDELADRLEAFVTQNLQQL